MANAKIGSQASWSGNLVESITAAKQLVPGDSGKVFMCDQNGTADVLINLPQLGTDIAGWNAKFVLRSNSTNDFIIMAYGLPAIGGSTGDSDNVLYREFVTDGNSTSGIATGDGVQFVNSQSQRGIRFDVFTDGVKWYIHGFATAESNMGAIDAA